VIDTFPRSRIMVCSSSGEIHGTRILDDSLAVAVAKFDRVALRLAAAQIGATGDSFAAGKEIARQLNAKELRAVLVLSDGLQVNGSELVRGINSLLPESVTVTGGLAGDGDRFVRTWVIAERRMTPGYVAAVGFYGDAVRVGHGSKGGWDAFGVERLVTRSRSNVLYELDGKPAAALPKTSDAEAGCGNRALFPHCAPPATTTSASCTIWRGRGDQSRRSRDIPRGYTCG
jgi:hypothetical protein